MKTLYLDCFSGASGDMLLGALLDLGLTPVDLQIELKKLHLPEKWHLHVAREQRLGIEGTKLTFHAQEHCHHDDHAHGHHHHQDCDHDHGTEHEHTHSHSRNYAQIVALLKSSDLADSVIQKSIAVFHRIAVAEGKIHGLPPDEVHFHEVGALDSILDIVGFCAGVELLALEQFYGSRLVEGSGFVACAHGNFPVPAPATLEILKGLPLQQTDEPHELLTPTGAALLAEFVQSFGPMPAMVVEKIGYGVGTRKLASRPNVVRAVLGEVTATSTDNNDLVTVLETNLDDISGEIIGAVQHRLFTAGALDVYYQPVQMKKNRPGTILSVICEPSLAPTLTQIMLTETTAFGVRQTQATRVKLQREIQTVTTPWGSVQVKLGFWQGQRVQIAPEFESCQALAQTSGKPLNAIYAAARAACSASA